MTGPGQDPPDGDSSLPLHRGPTPAAAPDRGPRGDAAVVFLRPELHPPSADDDGGDDDGGDDECGDDEGGDDEGGDEDAAERSAVSVLESAEPVDEPDGTGARTEWGWVQEWRAGAEPTPWATGLGLTMFAALVVGVAVWVLSAGLAGRPAVAVGVNLLVAGGLAPAMWLSRDLPVLRWIAAGGLLGILAGWIAALLMLPLPTP